MRKLKLFIEEYSTLQKNFGLFILLFLNLGSVVAQPLSRFQTVYIAAASNSYTFTNSDFLYNSLTGDLFSGIIVTALPTKGTLNYNGVAVSQTNVTQATVFADRTKFSFVPDQARTATAFTFKVKDSKALISAQSYSLAIKYNTPVSKVVRNDNTKYLQYKGLPYLLYGIQLRVDDYISTPSDSKYSNIYQYFQKTQQAGFRDALVPIPWSWLETADSVFNYTFIDDYLAYAKSYNLRLQFLWFGSNICAYTNVPAYIADVANKGTYPRITSTIDILNYSNPKLISKEVRAVKNLMTHLANYDLEKRVVLFQVENEPDHYGPPSNVDSILWAADQKVAAIHMMDTLGQVIHASNSDMITRVNLTAYSKTADDFANLKGIDIVGRDVYAAKYSPDFFNNSSMFDAFWNYNHTPENGAQYRNGINLAMSAFERANGYLLYNLRETGWRAKGINDNGLYRKSLLNDWVERDGTQTCSYWGTVFQQEVDMREIKSFNEMIYKADKRIATCPATKIIAFNLVDSQNVVNETKSFSTYKITYTSAVGGEALALEDGNGDLILLSLKDNSTFVFQTLPTNLHLSIGSFDDLNVWHQTSSRSIANNTIVLNAKEVALLTVTNYGPAAVETVRPPVGEIIYPNPNKGRFNVNLESLSEKPTLVEIFNMESQLVHSEVLKENELFMDVQGLKKGTYLLKLSGKNKGVIRTTKLIIK